MNRGACIPTKKHMVMARVQIRHAAQSLRAPVVIERARDGSRTWHAFVLKAIVGGGGLWGAMISLKDERGMVRLEQGAPKVLVEF